MSRQNAPHIVILGAGPGGLGAAWRLRESGKAAVTVLEQNADVGGNAGSFELAGIPVDYGSHRLHPATNPDILRDLQTLLGDELLDRPRHGRIRLQGRWIHFPLKAQDLALRLPLPFTAGVAADAVKKLLPKISSKNGKESFASVLEKGLGKTICRDFYFPYAEKIWGISPRDLSAIQARRRVSAGSLGKMIKKVLSIIPGFKAPGAGRFYYPKQGYGQISRAIAKRANILGAEIKLNSKVTGIDQGSEKHTVHFEGRDGKGTIEADHIWSTIPLTVLARLTDKVPADVIGESRKLSYRAMVLIYLVIGQDQWTEFDAHYFPEREIKLTRLSEPKNYAARTDIKGRTVLCGELPCDVGDHVWTASDEELGKLVARSLEECGLGIRSPIKQVVTKRLPFAYPIYLEGYEKHFKVQDEWAEGLDRVLTFGRQGLFAHDNTHHALAMAYAAVDCLDSGGNFDKAHWKEYRTEFEKHVVED
ncbi:MAG: FAD-dependent oxidoreductase [Pyrinomonadaceae bacterium]|nr:FAD-dependent oxidoreductase [Pyrinomonadaceae bacterium]